MTNKYSLGAILVVLAALLVLTQPVTAQVVAFHTGPLATAGAMDADEAEEVPVMTVDLAAKDALWLKNFNKQMLLSLDHGIGTIREQTLQNVIMLATMNNGRVSFRGTADKVYAVYRWSDSEAHRIMALQALHAIGDINTMEHLAQDIAREKSDRVRRHARRILASYYVEHLQDE